jgi:hypothetical protein
MYGKAFKSFTYSQQISYSKIATNLLNTNHQTLLCPCYQQEEATISLVLTCKDQEAKNHLGEQKLMLAKKLREIKTPPLI